MNILKKNKYILLKNKPLVIYGNPGSGKTHLACDILKDTVLLKLDTMNLKSIDDLKKYIIDRIEKRNITLMFKEKKECRSLLIDDLHVFQKYDKKSFKSIIDFLRDKKFYNTKIIITCDIKFIKNKDLKRCKLDFIECKYTYSEYYKICLKIFKNSKLDSDSIDRKIYESKYSFNNLISESNNKDKIIKDNFDGNEEITKKLLSNKYKVNEICRMCEGDEKIILLNLLENVNNNYYQIYNYVNVFNKEIFNHDFFLLISPICIIHMKSTEKDMKKEIIYNRYLSKNMISHKCKNNLNLFYLYLIQTYYKTEDIIYHNKVEKEYLNYHMDVYEKLIR